MDISDRINKAVVASLAGHMGFNDQLRPAAHHAIRVPIMVPTQWDDSPETQEWMAVRLTEMVLKDAQKVVIRGTGSFRAIDSGFEFVPFIKVDDDDRDMIRGFHGSGEASYVGWIQWSGIKFSPQALDTEPPRGMVTLETREAQIKRFFDGKD